MQKVSQDPAQITTPAASSTIGSKQTAAADNVPARITAQSSAAPRAQTIKYKKEVLQNWSDWKSLGAFLSTAIAAPALAKAHPHFVQYSAKVIEFAKIKLSAQIINFIKTGNYINREKMPYIMMGFLLLSIHLVLGRYILGYALSKFARFLNKIEDLALCIIRTIFCCQCSTRVKCIEGTACHQFFSLTFFGMIAIATTAIAFKLYFPAQTK